MSILMRGAGVVAAIALSGVLSPLHAESRGKPFTEAQLKQMSVLVFSGEVLETRSFPKYGRTVPTRVRVERSLKGSTPLKVRSVTPKDPGVAVYFDEEFDQAKVGDRGVFYVGTPQRPDLLMGFRKEPAPKR